MSKRYTRKQIVEAVRSGDRNFKGIGLAESGSSLASRGIDEIVLEDRLADGAGFDFAVEVKDVLNGGRIVVENCILEPESISDLKRRLGSLETQKKTYLCGFPIPEAYSLETAAKSCGYDELDSGAEPQDDDERRYVQSREEWYEHFVDGAIWSGMPEEVFGIDLQGDPFLLRAVRPDGEGIGLACRLISFQ